MADDVTLPGTGTVVRADDVGGKKLQVVKLDVGGDGVSLPVVDSLDIGVLPVAVLGKDQAVVHSEDNPVFVQQDPLSPVLVNSDNPLEVTVGGEVTIGGLPIGVEIETPIGATALASAVAVTLATDEPLVGIKTETAPASDTASSGLNGRLQRIAQRLSTIIGLLPTALGAGGGLKVDGSGTALPVSGTVAVTNSDMATVAGAVKAEDVASANAHTGIPAMAVRKATPANTSDTDGDYENLQVSAGRLWASATIDAALPAGSNAIGKLAANAGVNIGDVGNLATIGTSVTPGTGAANLGKAEDAVAGSGDVGVMALGVRADAPASTAANADYVPFLAGPAGGMWNTELADIGGGCDVNKNLDVDETEDAVKATAGTLYGWYIVNRTTSVRYVKFYNATVASVTVGTTVPDLTIEVPANSADHIAVIFAFTPGIKFGTAITVACTTGFADNDTGAPGTNDVFVMSFYK